jgi:23S rRNA (uridine2552-2'-O)-methyltransferase
VQHIKLLEIQEKYKMIKPGMTVVDLGCSTWKLVTNCRETGRYKGLVIASDILPMDAFQM